MNTDCAGYIAFVMLDEAANRIITLGGAGFETDAEWESEWAALPVAEHHTVFLADKEDAEQSIVADKPVTAETITAKLGEPIAVLIERGRVQAEKAEADFRKSLEVQSV